MKQLEYKIDSEKLGEDTLDVTAYLNLDDVQFDDSCTGCVYFITVCISAPGSTYPRERFISMSYRASAWVDGGRVRAQLDSWYEPCGYYQSGTEQHEVPQEDIRPICAALGVDEYELRRALDEAAQDELRAAYPEIEQILLEAARDYEQHNN